MNRIDLNCDLGESTVTKKITTDEKIIPLISSANVACGYHAGSVQEMEKTVLLCKKYGVGVGAHPSYFDPEGFGRREFNLPCEEIEDIVYKQVKLLYDICKKHGVALQHVKPHGALYNTAGKDERVAISICNGIKKVDKNLIVMGLSGSKLLSVAKNLNMEIASEVFADRNYCDDGSLVPRSSPQAMVTNEDLAVTRVIKMVKENLVESVSGKEIKILPSSLCVHGDGQKALLFVEKINKALRENGVEIKSLK